MNFFAKLRVKMRQKSLLKAKEELRLLEKTNQLLAEEQTYVSKIDQTKKEIENRMEGGVLHEPRQTSGQKPQQRSKE